jgi:SAM-dependent methyltransferase
MSRRYVRPAAIASDMGGEGEQLDQRMRDVMMLLECAPLDKVKSVLDVGIGKGQLAKWMAEKGKVVTGIGLALESYDLDRDALRTNYDIEILECDAEILPFKDNSFDAVVMSHILEHVGNVHAVLQEMRRVLKPEGYLLVFVPPHDDYAVAGHVSVGWNIGQLIYVLVVNGFRGKAGQFIEYGYNICGFVQKSDVELPLLRGDRGDIYILDKAELLPLPIYSDHADADQFWGKIKAINWPNSSHLIGEELSSKMKVLRTLAKIIPFKRPFGKLFMHLGRLLIEEGNQEFRINPRFLKGR